MQPPYIPPKDADYSNWLLNFATLIAADPTDYGLIAGDATIISAANTAFQAAYTLAINPATRTPASVAEKDTQRASSTATVRPYAQAIRNNAGVSDLLKIGVGVNLPNNTRTPIPAPITQPALALRQAQPLLHVLGYTDVGAPDGKSKPFGAIGVELRRTIGVAPAVDPDAAAYIGTYTKSPLSVEFISENVGKVATYFARFVTRSGPAGLAQAGPWSAPLSIGVI